MNSSRPLAPLVPRPVVPPVPLAPLAPVAPPAPIDPIVPTEACAWCGVSVTEDDGFLLRVGAKLCAACADQAGRIAEEQAEAQGKAPA